MGTFNLGPCNRQNYDTDIRIPFAISGPGIKAGSKVSSLASIPDIAPTILDLASVQPSDGIVFDGRSFAPMLAANVETAAAPWRDALLIEYYGVKDEPHKVSGHVEDSGNNTFRGLRIMNSSMNMAYFEFTDAFKDWNFKKVDFVELYDLDKDPYQLNNLHEKASSNQLKALSQQLHDQWTCEQSKCA